ncbi:MAG: ABC transporter permease, partial [Cyclobacteriaceae bacterium]
MNYKKLLFRFGPLLGLSFVYLLFLVISPPEFHSFYNTKTILTQTVIIGIAALGMTIVIIARGIDLSVGSQIALGTVVIASVLQGTAGTFGITMLAAIAGIVACALCGYLIGLITSRFNIVPFIVTLGMMQIARGVAKWIAKERTVSAPENWLQSLMMFDPEPGCLVSAPGAWITIIILIITVVILKYTV